MGKDIVLSVQHEEFAVEYMFGDNRGNGAQSYANVYNNGVVTASCYSAASKLLIRQDVKGYLLVVQDQQKQIAEYRKIHNTETLSRIIEEMSSATPTDHNGNEISAHLVRQTAITAIREQNKMLGLNEEKADLTVNGGMNFTFNLIPPTDEDQDEIDAEIAGIRKRQGDVEAEDVEFTEVKGEEF